MRHNTESVGKIITLKSSAAETRGRVQNAVWYL